MVITATYSQQSKKREGSNAIPPSIQCTGRYSDNSFATILNNEPWNSILSWSTRSTVGALGLGNTRSIAESPQEMPFGLDIY